MKWKSLLSEGAGEKRVQKMQKKKKEGGRTKGCSDQADTSTTNWMRGRAWTNRRRAVDALGIGARGAANLGGLGGTAPKCAKRGGEWWIRAVRREIP